MKLHFFGHATVGIFASDGARLLVDPYEPGGFEGKMNYPKIDTRFDFGIATHDHLDHAAFDHVHCDQIITSGEFGPFVVRRHTLTHDEYDGRRFGGNVDALIIEVDGKRIVHLSDVGHSPDSTSLHTIGKPDVLLVPVGGFYTIGGHQAWEWVCQTGARLSIPIHFRTPACELPIRGFETFLALMREYKRLPESFINIGDVMIHPPVVVLTPGLESSP